MHICQKAPTLLRKLKKKESLRMDWYQFGHYTEQKTHLSTPKVFLMRTKLTSFSSVSFILNYKWTKYYLHDCQYLWILTVFKILSWNNFYCKFELKYVLLYKSISLEYSWTTKFYCAPRKRYFSNFQNWARMHSNSLLENSQFGICEPKMTLQLTSRSHDRMFWILCEIVELIIAAKYVWILKE